MTDSQLAQIETALDLKLPEAFRRFMTEHAKALKAADRALRTEVVLETSPAPIIKLNKQLRKYGYEIDGVPVPWPHEYLAVSDNGAGDHECVKLDGPGGKVAVYRFDGEEGSFTRAFESLQDYLDRLQAKVKRHKSSPGGKSSRKLLGVVMFSGNASGLDISVKGIEPPATPDKLRERGVDLDKLQIELTRLLEAVTGVDRARWTTSLAPGAYPPLVRCAYATDDGSVPPLALGSLVVYEGTLRLMRGTRLATAEQVKNTPIQWDAFHDAVRGLHEAIIGKPLVMTPGPMKTEGDGGDEGLFECQYMIAEA